VTLSGTGFGRREQVVISAHGVRPVRTRATRRGRVTRTIRIADGSSGRVKLTLRSRTRKIVAYFGVSSLPVATETSELALAGGLRVRWTPRRSPAGTTILVKGARVGSRKRGFLAFPHHSRSRFTTSRRGGFSVSLPVPEIAPGRHSFEVRRRGLRLRLPFEVAPDPVIAGAGDIACGSNSTSAQCRQMVTSDELLGIAPAAVLALGDVQYEFGEYQNFLNFYEPSWGRVKGITYPVVGNHEYGTSDAAGCGYACGYFDYFNGIGQAFGRAGERNKGYYAVDVGAWRLYAMNSNCSRTGAPGCGPGSAQLRFLEEDLAAHPRQCSLMFMHHPLFTSDTRDFDGEDFRALLRPLWQAFYDHGGDVVLTGHTHFYERFAPQTPQGQLDPARGIRQFIVGTGGRNVYSAGALEPNSEVRVEKTMGVIKMALHASSYDWQFVPEPGKTLTDSGTQRCH
jgi:3',5'-cyclic AMP phosphodiesterase CpdA